MRWAATLVLACAGCSRPAEVPAVSRPQPSVASTPRVDDATARAGYVQGTDRPEAGWFEALPLVEHGRLTVETQRELQRCLVTHRVKDDDANASDLAAAAACVRGIGAPESEIDLLKALLERFPSADETPSATLRMAQAYEQIDFRPEAVRAYLTYLRKYPKHPEARASGQRAVCLALSLGDEPQVAELLAALEGHYGRKGFQRPSPETLLALCANVPPRS